MYQVGTTVYQYNPTLRKWEGIASSPAGTYPSPNFSAPGLPYVAPGSVLGTATTNTTRPAASTGANDFGMLLAQSQRANDLDSIKRKFDAAKQTASDYQGSGQRTFDTLTKSIGDFRQRSGDLKTSAGQEIINSASGILGNNARNYEDTVANSRLRARAMGLGAGSRLGGQNALGGAFAALQGNTIAKQGENQMANTNLYNERMSQADTQQGNANTYLQDVNSAVQRLLTQGTDQFGTDVRSAENTYGQNLDNILARQRTLEAMNPMSSGGLSGYQANYSGIANPLTSMPGVNTQSGMAGDTASNLNIPVSEYIKKLMYNKAYGG